MRPKERMPELMAAIQDVWDKNPDLRLGQLIMNAVLIVEGGTNPARAVFNIEDDKILNGLKALAELPTK